MQVRRFGNLDWPVSALGFGCMRLPVIDGKHDHIDEPEATRMLHYAIDRGVNYVDTAYPYHGGNSERFLGRFLKDGYREQVKLATKLPSWLVKEPQDYDRLLNAQLERLQTNHIDVYLLHTLDKHLWDKLRGLDVLEWAEKAIADGRIGHLGFSFHDRYPVFQEIVDGYDKWACCQIQHNYMDIENQAGTRGLHYAASKGLAVVIMEPLLGGNLADPPAPIRRIWDKASSKRTPVEWALQWLWNQPEVSVVLSGMSAMEHVIENVASAATSGVRVLSPEDELPLYDEVRAQYEEFSPIPCTRCEYCLPCPEGIDIPSILQTYNYGFRYQNIDRARDLYGFVAEEERADACVGCQNCEQLCPQSIPISEWMPHIHAVLGEKKAVEEVPSPA